MPRPVLPRLCALVPVLSVGVFAGLYALAAWLYPGGTRRDPVRLGFSWVDNYWCDLLDPTTFGGQANPARPVALAAMLALGVGLAVLWWTAPALYPEAPRRAAIVRVAGLACAATMPCVATRFHDLVINVAGLFGAVALVVTMTALGKRGGRALAVVAWSALCLALVTYLIWRTGVALPALPLVQKAAFVAFLGWVVLAARRVGEGGAGARQPP